MLETEKQQINEIIWTKEYDEFKLYEKNRNVDYNFVNNKIKNSLTEHGWLSTNPLIVDKEFRIRDGQHRFMAAKELGIPIPVLIVEDFDDETMIAINNASKKWTDKDYLLYRAKTGDNVSGKLIKLIDKYKIGVRQAMYAANIVNRLPICSSTAYRDFSILEAEMRLDRVMELCELLKPSIKKRTNRLVSALLRIMKNSRYEHKRMVNKIKDQQDRLHHCNSLEAWIEMLENIYNYRNSNKVFFSISTSDL